MRTIGRATNPENPFFPDDPPLDLFVFSAVPDASHALVASWTPGAYIAEYIDGKEVRTWDYYTEIAGTPNGGPLLDILKLASHLNLQPFENEEWPLIALGHSVIDQYLEVELAAEEEPLINLWVYPHRNLGPGTPIRFDNFWQDAKMLWGLFRLIADVMQNQMPPMIG